MNNRKSSTSFEISLKVSPIEAKKRIADLSDDMDVKTDKEAWMSLIQGYRGSSRFLHLLNKNGIFIQRRAQLSSPHYGVKIQIKPTSYGSKLIGSLTLTPKLRAFYAIWFGGMVFALIIVAISLPREIVAGEKPKSDWVWIFFPIGMLLAGYLFTIVTKLLSSKELRQVQEWLNNLFADSKVNL